MLERRAGGRPREGLVGVDDVLGRRGQQLLRRCRSRAPRRPRRWRRSGRPSASWIVTASARLSSAVVRCVSRCGELRRSRARARRGRRSAGRTRSRPAEYARRVRVRRIVPRSRPRERSGTTSSCSRWIGGSVACELDLQVSAKPGVSSAFSRSTTSLDRQVRRRRSARRRGSARSARGRRPRRRAAQPVAGFTRRAERRACARARRARRARTGG